ncbi:hypothetical protein SAMN04488005_1163 [Yoonia tamlensis]|uniref:Uncharacterized protein n=1 Tax=Yoonia tamlensis TaxID=390270 RepID=A0A1I6G6Q1_9RHOB|nr:hypothetical protein [Yoonia tamlensis]SFR37874.1 hypothetical protein SAMN04488005_1163 [Yoonia tamlensis]
MTHASHRYFVNDPQTAAALRRDGIGWDHDPQSLILPRLARPRLIARILHKKGTRK